MHKVSTANTISHHPTQAATTVISVFCAWCDEYMGSKDGDGKGIAGDSHSICNHCFEEQISPKPVTV